MNKAPAAPVEPAPTTPHEEPEYNLHPLPWRQQISACVLCYVNLINYMDRYTIAGILDGIQREFNIGDSFGGLLQTVFVLSYMIFAPIVGYLGDRYSRRWLMTVGVAIWNIATLVGSFAPDYNLFLLTRAFVGIGQACFSTISPTIISDLFVDDKRSKMLALFYFAIPVGSGLGYIIGASAKSVFGDWRYGLRATPCLGILGIFLILLTKDPARGEIEGTDFVRDTGYFGDIKTLVKNRSFMFSSLGFACVAYVTGALGWWGPKFIELGQKIVRQSEQQESTEVSLMFGAVSMLAGIIGVPMGSMIATKLRHKYPTADPLICSVGLFVSTPFVFATLVVANINTNVVYILIFFGSVALNLNWAIVADILLYVVDPMRRSSAEAFQILISYALGAASSPYLVGLMSDFLRQSFEKEMEHVNFRSLQYALFTTCVMEFFGGFFFLLTSCYIVGDKELAHKHTVSITSHTSIPLSASATPASTNPSSATPTVAYPAITKPGESVSSKSSKNVPIRPTFPSLMMPIPPPPPPRINIPRLANPSQMNAIPTAAPGGASRRGNLGATLPVAGPAPRAGPAVAGPAPKAGPTVAGPAPPVKK